MRKYLLLLCLPFALFSCKKNTVTTPTVESGASMAMMKVNYKTDSLEGGMVYNFPTYSSIHDSIPLKVMSALLDTLDYSQTVLRYEPTFDTLFNSVVDSYGVATIRYPDFLSVRSFLENKLSAPYSAPANSSIQKFTLPGAVFPSYNVAAVWKPVSNLQITQQFMSNPNVRVGLYLYVPSMADTDGSDWAWIWVFYKAK
jgi:hypothetical protein